MERTFEQRSLELSDQLEILIKACDRACAAYASLATLTKMERATLNILGEVKSVSIGQLSDRLGSPMSSTSVLVDGLEKSGLAERTRLPEDRRSVSVSLSPRGKSAYEDLVQSRLSFAQDLLGPMIAEDQVKFLNLIAIARKALEDKSSQSLASLL